MEPEQIAPEEWDVAVVTTLTQLGSASPDALARGVNSGFQYKNLTTATRTQTMEAVARLVAARRVVERDGLVHLVQPIPR